MSESFEKSLSRRYFLNEYHSFKQRKDSELIKFQQNFRQVVLDTHNVLRALHCVPPLTLDDKINERAQTYAEQLANTDSLLYHSKDREGLLGENLYLATRSNPITNPDGDKVTRTWYAEVAVYDYNKPVYSKKTAHFTQVVWKATEKLGVGIAFGKEGRKMYVVAQYGPAGNIEFEYNENVFKPKC